jgi:hypothetical protein
MMSLVHETGGISIRLPAATDDIILERWDHKTREAFIAELPRKVSLADEGEAKPVPTGIKATADKENLLGFQAHAYTNSPPASAEPATAASKPTTEMESRGVGGEFNEIAVPVNLQQRFTAWVAEAATGRQVTGSFIDRFTRQMEPGQQDHWLYQGLLRRQVELLHYGIPLHLLELVDSRVGTATLGTRKSESWVNSLQLIDLDPSLCDHSSIPEGFQLSR